MQISNIKTKDGFLTSDVVVMNSESHGYEHEVIELDDELVQWHVKRYEDCFMYESGGLKAWLVVRHMSEFDDGTNTTHSGTIQFFAASKGWGHYTGTGQTVNLFGNNCAGALTQEQAIELFEGILKGVAEYKDEQAGIKAIKDQKSAEMEKFAGAQQTLFGFG
jgi:hypothetical protein